MCNLANRIADRPQEPPLIIMASCKNNNIKTTGAILSRDGMLASAFAVMAIILAFGCANNANLSVRSESGNPLSLRPLEISGRQINHVRAASYVFETPDEWLEFWSRYGKTTPPEVDLETFTLVAVFLGQKPNPGYSVKIAGAVEYQSEVVINVVEYLPSPGMLYAQVIVYPYDAALIPKTGKQIRFASTEMVGHP